MVDIRGAVLLCIFALASCKDDAAGPEQPNSTTVSKRADQGRLDGLARPNGAPWWLQSIGLRFSVEEDATVLTAMLQPALESDELARGDLVVEALCKLSGATFVRNDSVGAVRGGKLVKRGDPLQVRFETVRAAALPESCQITWKTVSLRKTPEGLNEPYHEATVFTCWDGSSLSAEPCTGYPKDGWITDAAPEGTAITDGSLDVTALSLDAGRRQKSGSEPPTEAWTLRLRADVTVVRTIAADAAIAASVSCDSDNGTAHTHYLGLAAPSLAGLRPGVSITLETDDVLDPQPAAGPAKCTVELKAGVRMGDGPGPSLGKWCMNGGTTQRC